MQLAEERSMSKLIYSTATDFAKLIREKRASAVEIVDAHLMTFAGKNPNGQQQRRRTHS